MPLITLYTRIHAPVDRCFRLALSVDVHMSSTAGTHEKAIAGVTSGVMKLNDTVTWRARHFGITQTLTSRITVCDAPHRFVDEMVKGIFRKIHHCHLFYEEEGMTVMKDEFSYEAPLGILGRLAETLFLTAYLRRFLLIRNDHIRQTAEGDGWKVFLEKETTPG